MSNRLEILERERERLQRALQQDPYWRALLKARPGLAAGKPIKNVPADIAAGLAKSEVFIAFAKVRKDITALKNEQARMAATRPASQRAPTPAPAAAPIPAAPPTPAAVASPTPPPPLHAPVNVKPRRPAEVNQAATEPPPTQPTPIKPMPAPSKAVSTHQAASNRAGSSPAAAALPTPAANEAMIEPPVLKLHRELASALSARPSSEPTAAPPPGRLPKRPPEPASTNSPERAPAPPREHIDDLTAIRLIDRKLARALNDLGVHTFDQIAAWDRVEVRRVRDALGLEKRVWRENWIEQAALLHMTGATAYSRRPRSAVVLRPQNVPVAATPTVGPATLSAAAPATASPLDTSTTPGADLRAPPAAEPRLYHEDLQQISGINAEVERLLNAQRVTRISQIADWSDDQQRRIDLLLGGMNRVERENWVAQARQLTGYTDQAPAQLAGGVAVAADLPDDGADDLKRIRGIGAVIEQKLYAMGYTRYDQVGSWTQPDIERVSQKLDFRGRIERENWIEQARILATGGQTDFSRRQDKS